MIYQRMELWLIRHGETLWNRQQRAQGQLDIPLSELGVAQAEALAQRLKHTKFAALISSDLSRAYRTAEICAAQLEMPIVTDPAWREIHCGEIQGLTLPEIEAKGLSMRHKPVQYAWLGGESRSDVMQRVEQAMLRLHQPYAEARVAVFTHGGTIRGAIHVALDDFEQKISLGERGNTSISIVQIRADARGRLLVYNDTAHLMSLPSSNLA